MKIEKVYLKSLRNEEHYQFGKDVSALVVKYKAATLNVEAAFADYSVQIKDEAEALELITKSALTASQEEADYDRDIVFRGLADTVDVGVRHFKPAVRQAAAKLKVVFDHYGNLAVMPYDQESASIANLLGDLNTTYKADVTAAGLTEWVTELTARNAAFVALRAARNTELSTKTSLRMKEVRVKVDAAYTLIVDRVNSQALLNGDTVYAPFINEMNALVSRYQNTIAKRRGTAAAAKEKAKEKEVKNE